MGTESSPCLVKKQQTSAVKIKKSEVNSFAFWFLQRTFTFTPRKNVSDKIVLRGLNYGHNVVNVFNRHTSEEDIRRGSQSNDR